MRRVSKRPAPRVSNHHAVSSLADDMTLPANTTADGSGRCARGSDRSWRLPVIVVDNNRLGIIGLVVLNKSGMECLTLGATGDGVSALPPDWQARGTTYRKYLTSMKRRRQVMTITSTHKAAADCHPYLSKKWVLARGEDKRSKMPGGCTYKTALRSLSRRAPETRLI